MEVTVEQHGPVAVVAVTGNIDAMTSPQLMDAFSEQISAGNVLLVADLSGVDYTSSAGLRALLASLKDSRREGGDFRLAGVRGEVHRVLELAGFTSILKHYPTVEEAVASFGD
jgi:anti-anti-sigma factor